jgi:exosome complex component CSL4
MAANPTPIAIPGQDLGSLSTYIPGPGTHTVNNRLYASIPGAISISQAAKAPGPQKRLTKITPLTAEQKATVSIIRTAHTAGDADEAADKGAKQQVLPEVGSTVLCKVTRITPRQATVAILVVGETVLDGEWTGLISVQDVRATEKDRVKIFESFRPGDIVRATVVCLSFLERNGYFDTNQSKDFARRPGQLLSQHCQQCTGCYHGNKRGRKCHVPCQLEGI